MKRSLNPLLLSLITVLFAFFQNIFSQTTGIHGKGKISGKVIDSTNELPIEYVSIGLLRDNSNIEINGSTTDSNGNFTINNIPDGCYNIALYFMGYKNGAYSDIEISKVNRDIHLGNIRMVGSECILAKVSTKTKANTVEYTVDKIVYNAENDITSQGGSAIDILRKVPQVSVDINGNVELQGKSNIRFLINGKPSSIFGNSLADALAAIPVSQIKSIEAITSPGAKYDAQGTGGIINIILKDNKLKGFDGNVALNAGTRFETGTLNLNFRNNNLGINTFFSGNAQLNSHTPNSQDRTSIDINAHSTTHLLQQGYTDFKRHGLNVGIGFDWSISKRNTLTGSVTSNLLGNQSLNELNQQQLTMDYSGSILLEKNGYRNSTNHSSVTSVDLNLNYRKGFKKKGEELIIALITSNSQLNSNYRQVQIYSGAAKPYNGTVSNNLGTDNNLNFSIDYILPVSEHFSVEMGVKHVQQHIVSVTDIGFLQPQTELFQHDTLQSNRLKYIMKINAAYVSSAFTLFKRLDVRVGARTEYTGIAIDFPNTHMPSYKIVVPSVILSRKFKKNRLMKMAYTRRIERPDYSSLNPFANLSDPHNISKGNPGLHYEISDNVEIGYSKTFTNGGNLYLGLNEWINTFEMRRITTFYPTYNIGDSTYTNVSVSIRRNIDAGYNSGGNISFAYPITKTLNMRGNFSAVHRYIFSSMYFGNMDLGFVYRGTINISLRLPRDFIIEAFGNYTSTVKSVQGLNPQYISYFIACRKQFWNKKASIGLTATNPFNRYIKQVTTLSTDNYSSYSVRKLPYRYFGISFTCKLGKLEFKKKKDEGRNDFINNPPPY